MERNIVNSIFPSAVTLREFIVAHIQVNATPFLEFPGDTESYRNLLHKAIVIIPAVENDINKQTFPHPPPQIIASSISDVVNRIVAGMVRNNTNYKELNCLALGYCRKSTKTSVDMSSNMRNHMDVECYFVNTVHNMVSTKTWHLLATRIGNSICSLSSLER